MQWLIWLGLAVIDLIGIDIDSPDLSNKRSSWSRGRRDQKEAAEKNSPMDS